MIASSGKAKGSVPEWNVAASLRSWQSFAWQITSYWAAPIWPSIFGFNAGRVSSKARCNRQRCWRPLESYIWYVDMAMVFLFSWMWFRTCASETGLVKIFCCACSWNIRHAHEPRRAVRYIKRMRMLGLMHLVRICLPFDPILVLKACQNTSSWPTVATSNDIWIYIILYICDLQIESLWYLIYDIFFL